ncbi:MAG: hypothetical protein JWO38_1497 [Gemmataceae bacterium]|nr:hypothetical protein [Gemmataceae bacterium]
MGHSEMLLAVAGLKPDEVKARTKKLAGGDWSDFPKAERAAFGLAYKLSREPGKLTDQDRAGLVAVFGENRAVDLIWYTAWCNYMTRVADAFQLPLERDNVFTPPPKKPADEKKQP